MATKITLAEIVETAGDLPQEGMLNLLGRLAYKARSGKIELEATGGQVSELYNRFLGRDLFHTEEIESTFSYLLAISGRTREAKDSYQKHIQFLEKRGADGMAGDVALEAAETTKESAFISSARLSFERQIKKMNEERSGIDGETNEAYYDEMLSKAGRYDALRKRKEEYLKGWLGRGEFRLGAKICRELGRTTEAERYQKLADILA